MKYGIKVPFDGCWLWVLDGFLNGVDKKKFNRYDEAYEHAIKVWGSGDFKVEEILDDF